MAPAAPHVHEYIHKHTSPHCTACLATRLLSAPSGRRVYVRADSFLPLPDPPSSTRVVVASKSLPRPRPPAPPHSASPACQCVWVSVAGEERSTRATRCERDAGAWGLGGGGGSGFRGCQNVERRRDRAAPRLGGSTSRHSWSGRNAKASVDGCVSLLEQEQELRTCARRGHTPRQSTPNSAVRAGSTCRSWASPPDGRKKERNHALHGGLNARIALRWVAGHRV